MKNLAELKEAIAALVAYNRDEEKDWEQWASYGKGKDFELSGYDPSLCPGHIYHTIQRLKQFIEEPESGSQGSLS